MKDNKPSSLSKLFSNPAFFLVAIVAVIASLLYFSGSPNQGKNMMVSDYEHIDGVVTLVEYGDYQCPACGAISGVVEQVLKDYGTKIKLEYRHFPLPFHEFALKASVAAECANDQGKFVAMHGKMYSSQDALDVNSLKKYAVELGMDSGTFNKCLDGDQHMDKINSQKEQGNQDSVAGTPTFFVNGKLLKNSKDEKYLPVLEDFKSAIDAELAKNK